MDVFIKNYLYFICLFNCLQLKGWSELSKQSITQEEKVVEDWRLFEISFLLRITHFTCCFYLFVILWFGFVCLFFGCNVLFVFPDLVFNPGPWQGEQSPDYWLPGNSLGMLLYLHL